MIEANTWYRPRLHVEIGTTQSELCAKAWADGQAEPNTWQAQCSHASSSLPLVGTIGVWSSGGGSKFWDAFEAIALPADAPAGGAPAPPTLLLD